MLKYATFIILVAATVPATAQVPATSAPENKAAAATNPLDKVLCRTEEGLGSRLNRKRVCMTVRDWQEQAQDSREATEKLQQQGQQNPSGN